MMGRKSTGGAQAGDGGLEVGSRNAGFCFLFFLFFSNCQKESKQLTLYPEDPVQTFTGLSVGYVSGDFAHCADCL